jgi:hypothetical protein
MTDTQTAPITGLTPGERAHIRSELTMFFSTLPTVGAWFSTQDLALRPGARQAEALKCRQGVAGARMMRLDTGGRLPRLVLTETGIVAWRAMMSDRRVADPGKFAHVRQELGIDPAPRTEAPHL